MSDTWDYWKTFLKAKLPDGNTNNFAEAHAIEEALQKADELGLDALEIRTDSQYCIDSLEKWCKGWIRKAKVRIWGKIIYGQTYTHRCENPKPYNIEFGTIFRTM